MHYKKWTAAMMTGVLSLSLLAGCANQNAQQTPVETDGQTETQTQTQEPVQTIDPNALVIAEQGIFSAGGITVTSEGTFNPEDQWEETGAGQTAHVDHANVLYQIPAEKPDCQ